MSTNLVHFSSDNMNRIFYAAQLKYGESNKENITRMKKILYSAIQSELTEKQRICLVEHYMNGKKEKDIADEQRLNPSTVSRHISKAKEKLRRVASYYM